MPPEVINIISESYKSNKVGGPRKVIENLIKGLDRINYPYVINMSINDYKYNYIQDSTKAIIEISLKKIPSVIGPNLAVLPHNLPVNINSLKNCIYLQPSKWCIDLWKMFDVDKNHFMSWPVGIDIDNFTLQKELSNSVSKVMIYSKKRNPQLIEKALQLVKEKGYMPIIIEYGKYNELQYKKTLSECKFGIWIGISESQGIGLQEALAANLPLIVCDVNTLFESVDNEYRFPQVVKNFKPTSAPYFDETCGIKINDISNLEYAIDEMCLSIKNYKPREFVQQNLSLEKQAKDFVGLFSILEKENQIFFTNKIFNYKSKPFKPSITANVFYLLFVLKRKTKTLINYFK